MASQEPRDLLGHLLRDGFAELGPSWSPGHEASGLPTPSVLGLPAVTGRGMELTFTLASSRPLLLLSFSTKRGSTADNLGREAQTWLSVQDRDHT